MVRRASACLMLACLALPAPAVRAQESVAFDRPGIGFSTTTLQPGRLAWEQGLPDVEYSHDAGGRSRLLMADTLLRLGLTDGLELQVGTDGYGWLSGRDAEGRWHAHGLGNASIGLKRVLPSRWAGVSWALRATANLPTGRGPLGGGDRQYELGLAAQWDLGRERTGALYLGRSAGAGRGWMLAPSYGFALPGDWSGYVEAGLGRGDQRGRQWGGGVTWQPVHRFQLDFSVLRGSHGAPDWQGGIGIALAFP